MNKNKSVLLNYFISLYIYKKRHNNLRYDNITDDYI